MDDISFHVDTGEVFALLGPNGAGKTSTIEMLEGFRSRDAGKVSVLGMDPSSRAFQRRLRERLGVVLQDLVVEPFLSVEEVLSRSASYFPDPRDVGEVIRPIGLEGKATARVRSLSGGQQRRLDLGLGIIGNPELLFLDEPTTGFDPSARRGAWDVVRNLVRDGTVGALGRQVGGVTGYLRRGCELPADLILAYVVVRPEVVLLVHPARVVVDSRDPLRRQSRGP